MFIGRSVDKKSVVSEAESFFFNFYSGSEFYEYRYRQSGQLCSKFSPVLEFTISDRSVLVSPSSTGTPLSFICFYLILIKCS